MKEGTPYVFQGTGNRHVLESEIRNCQTEIDNTTNRELMLGKRESGDLLRSLMEKMLKKRGIGNGLNICQHQKLEGKIFVPCYDRKSYFCQEISLIFTSTSYI